MTSISIIIPAHNEAQHLPNLLNSLAAVDCLTDIIIVDSGSTDNTSEIGQQFGCRVLSLPKKQYPSVARNRGAQQSSAEILVFLDADVIVTESWAAELRHLASDNEFLRGNVLTGETYHISLNPSWIEKFWFEPLRQRKKTYLNGGNIIISRTAFDSIGGFNEQLETGEDVDFSIRAQEKEIELTFNPALVVHHEGFPKDIKNFFRREKWHGKGDFSSLSYFRKSRVAQLSVLFGVCYITLLLLLALTVQIDSVLIKQTIIATVVLIFAVCLSSSLAKFGKLSPIYSILGTFIYFIYFNARLASLFALWRGR
ncbi:MAG: glycosyltransferase [Cellvibrionaceae bacterium]